MKNREHPVARSPLCRLKDDAVRDSIDPFPGMTAGGGVEIMNLSPTRRGLAVQKPFAAVTADNAPLSVRGIYSFENKLLLLNLRDGALQYYVYDGSSFVRSYQGAETYPYDFNGRDLIGSVICTEDGFPHIYETAPTKKMLFFPANVWAEANDGTPGAQHTMPEGMPRLTAAAVAGGRLYGVNGQTVYVSGSAGCFSWVFDEEGAAPDPAHAWKAVCATATEKQTPVVAVTGYKNCVLIFRRNALQKITGSGNPFTVKDLYRVGTFDAGSICELDGDLYFVSENGFCRFNGSRLKRYELPDAQAIPAGPACVSEGRYCVYAEKNGTGLIYRYDPRTDSFGVSEAPGKIRAFAQCADRTFALVAPQYAGTLYALSGGVNAVHSAVKIPLLPGEHTGTELESLCLRFTASAGASLSVSLEATDDGGNVRTRLLRSLSNLSGRKTARLRVRVRSLSRSALILNGTGNLFYESCEARFRRKPRLGDKT